MTTGAPETPRKLDDVPGWFHAVDRALFAWILKRQTSAGARGNLVELGAYMGKSAIVIGRALQPGEQFTVLDLFGMPASHEANRPAADFYAGHLTREAFERNYLAFHEELPQVIQAPSSAILDHVEPASCRFVHIDASHVYEFVKADIAAARVMLQPGGVVVMDDYRTAHTPGTAAAVWEAVLTGGLRPICVTAMKFYATWDDPTETQDALSDWVAGRPDLKRGGVQDVAGHRMFRVFTPKAQAAGDGAAKTQAGAPAKAAPSAPKPPRKPAPQRSLPRRIALELAPPALVKAVRRRRRRGGER